MSRFLRRITNVNIYAKLTNTPCLCIVQHISFHLLLIIRTWLQLWLNGNNAAAEFAHFFPGGYLVFAIRIHFVGQSRSDGGCCADTIGNAGVELRDGWLADEQQAWIKESRWDVIGWKRNAIRTWLLSWTRTRLCVCVRVCRRMWSFKVLWRSYSWTGLVRRPYGCRFFDQPNHTFRSKNKTRYLWVRHKRWSGHVFGK